jgi:glutamate-1-semialdehyde 2,1-aminomutase
MAKLSPAGPVYQAGTLSGNPVAVAAGRAVLKKLRPEVYQRLEELGAGLEEGIGEAVRAAGASVTRVGSMFTIFFRPTAPRHFEEAMDSDRGRFAMFHQQALDRGVYLPPSQFEAAFIPATLTDAELAKTVDVIRAVL